MLLWLGQRLNGVYFKVEHLGALWEITGGGGYNTSQVVTYNTLRSFFLSKNFRYFLHSAKGQFAEMVVYNTLDSKNSGNIQTAPTSFTKK